MVGQRPTSGSHFLCHLHTYPWQGTAVLARLRHSETACCLSFPTWMGIPGSFPNGSSPHENSVTLNMSKVSVDAQCSKCNMNFSLLSLWEASVGPQF